MGSLKLDLSTFEQLISAGEGNELDELIMAMQEEIIRGHSFTIVRRTSIITSDEVVTITDKKELELFKQRFSE
jgi:hypothetical protein